MKFRLHNKDDLGRIVGVLSEILRSKTPHIVDIKPWRANRTNEQNARYWAILNEISQGIEVWDEEQQRMRQYSSDSWHTYFRDRFLGYEPGVHGTGVLKSTTKLKVDEFSEYMEKIEACVMIEHKGFQFDYDAIG